MIGIANRLSTKAKIVLKVKSKCAKYSGRKPKEARVGRKEAVGAKREDRSHEWGRKAPGGARRGHVGPKRGRNVVI